MTWTTLPSAYPILGDLTRHTSKKLRGDFSKVGRSKDLNIVMVSEGQ